MKITRKQLKNLIAEELRSSGSVLLEMPGMGGSYREEDNNDNEQINLTGQKLYHMARQADQLHDMLRGNEKLVDKVRVEILDIAEKLREIFEAVTFEKDNPKGR